MVFLDTGFPNNTDTSSEEFSSNVVSLIGTFFDSRETLFANDKERYEKAMAVDRNDFSLSLHKSSLGHLLIGLS